MEEDPELLVELAAMEGSAAPPQPAPAPPPVLAPVSADGGGGAAVDLRAEIQRLKQTAVKLRKAGNNEAAGRALSAATNSQSSMSRKALKSDCRPCAL